MIRRMWERIHPCSILLFGGVIGFLGAVALGGRIYLLEWLTEGRFLEWTRRTNYLPMQQEWFFDAIYGRPVVAVAVGIVFGLIVTRVVFPRNPVEYVNRVKAQERSFIKPHPKRSAASKRFFRRKIAQALLLLGAVVVSGAVFGYSSIVAMSACVGMQGFSIYPKQKRVWGLAVSRVQRGLVPDAMIEQVNKEVNKMRLGTVVCALMTCMVLVCIVYFYVSIIAKGLAR